MFEERDDDGVHSRSTPESCDLHASTCDGDTCGFYDPTDQVNVPAQGLGGLNLGPLQDNGGPTDTHALLPGSVAIDAIHVDDWVDSDGLPLLADQRGVARPQGSACDVGAVEVPEPSMALLQAAAFLTLVALHRHGGRRSKGR